MRKYKIEGLMPTSMHFVAIYHCNHGKVDYLKNIRVQNSQYFDWNRPFCVVRPSTRVRPFPNATIHATNGKILAVKTLIANKIDQVIQSWTSNHHFRFIGKKESHHLEDIQNSNLQTSLQYESGNLICYKLARRKKYAQRNIAFYMPQTFVGGLYECQTSPELKQQILNNLTLEDYFSFKTFDFKCDSSISTLLKPVIAEDGTKQYFTRVSTSIIQNIPYLTTASPFDLRFSVSESSDMTSETWGRDIDVNEEYTYNVIELNMILIATAVTSNYLNDLINIKPTFKLLKYFSLRAHELDNDSYFSNDQKLSFLLNHLNHTDSLLVLRHIQRLWDQIT